MQNHINLGNILVTGGLGFIGYNLIGEICKNYKYDKIIILDEKGSLPFEDDFGIKDNSKIEFVQSSILNFSAATMPTNMNYIIHAAGFLGVEEVNKKSIKTLDVNVLGTRNCLLFASKNNNLRRFVTISSSEIYGPVAENLSEDCVASIPSEGARWCYSASKVAAEQYTKAFSREMNIPYTIIRPFNVFGPYRLGQNAMTNFLEKSLKGEDFIVYGNGLQRRSWCYVDDFIIGLLKAMQNERSVNHTFNIGNPDNYLTVIELLEVIRKINNTKSAILFEKGFGADVISRLPHIEKARKILGFHPCVTLETGISKTLNWLKKINANE